MIAIVIGRVLAGAAAAIHVAIWWLESIVWESPRARRTFGTSVEEARATKAMAFNQGYETWASRPTAPDSCRVRQ